jgi:hypothetical protein
MKVKASAGLVITLWERKQRKEEKRKESGEGRGKEMSFSLCWFVYARHPFGVCARD